MRAQRVLFATSLVAAAMFARHWIIPAGQASLTPLAQERLELAPLKKHVGVGASAPAPPKEAGPEGNFTEFHRLTTETLAELPRLQDFKKRRNFHFTPPELLAASPALGKIQDSLDAHPELVPQGIEFYDRCARDEEVLTAIRVVCLHHMRYRAKQQPDVTEVREADYPEEIWRLTHSLPPIR